MPGYVLAGNAAERVPFEESSRQLPSTRLAFKGFEPIHPAILADLAIGPVHAEPGLVRHEPRTHL